MTHMKRRDFLALAASYGASLAWPRRVAAAPWKERRDLYPHGVASGDPHPDSVILWTRRTADKPCKLTVDVAEDRDFHNIVSSAEATVSAETDWTCRVLATGLAPSRVYYYRFTDEQGFGSRIGRTITAPIAADPHPVRFAFVSCQNNQAGACSAYRRMIYEDQRRPAAEQLGFVMHLGDFVYEIMWYPEDRPMYYARKIRDIVRYKSGEKHRDFHVPTTVDDYRALYRAYLLDPDLQEARAHLPFVYMWDNHEFSWKCWQSQQNFGEGAIPAQTRKVAACQAWFENQPARVVVNGSKPGGVPKADRYAAAPVKDVPLTNFDEGGLGEEPNNLAAIHSMTLYRSLRYGRNVDLILTDNRSFRAEPITDRAEFAPFKPSGFPQGIPADILETLDAGRTANNGHAPEKIAFNGAMIANPRKDGTPLSMLGKIQKGWFLNSLRTSTAPWKLWGNSVGMVDWRLDFHNLPANFPAKWPGSGYATMIDDDWSGYRSERAEILDYVREHGIAGFATLAGDRHAFSAGVVSPSLPPEKFEPVGVEFITASISAPGLFEALEYGLPKDHPQRPIFVHEPVGGGAAQPAVNFTLMHGVRASLALQRTGSRQAALKESNAEAAPHLSFVDVGAHGYTTVRATATELEVEFVCIPRPLERSPREDGAPLAYRLTHRVPLWKPGARPRIERAKQEGTLPLSV